MNLAKPLTKALLHSEKKLRLELEAIADRHFDWLGASLEANPAATDGMIAASLARDSDWLELEAQAAMVRGREKSRNGAWLIFLPFLERIGVRNPTRRPTSEYDEAKASFAARGVALAYAAIVQAILAQWRSKGKAPGELAKAVREHRARMPSAIERTAATENAEAFNNELLTQGTPPDGGPRPILWTWDAILDKRVCPTCGRLDSQQVPDGQLFELDGVRYWPPAHPRCRCVAVPSAAPWTGVRTSYVGSPVSGPQPSPWFHDDQHRPDGSYTIDRGAPQPEPHERLIDEYLLRQGNDVHVPAYDKRAQGIKRPDRHIGGSPVEYTSALKPGADANTLASKVNNKASRAQAPYLIIDARNATGIDREAALHVLNTRMRPANLRQVRVIGNDFDVTCVVR